MSQLYGLTPRTAGQLRDLLADGGETGGRASSGAAARGVTWVKVTGAAVSGWYPGVVSLDAGGTWSDLTAAVKVQSADGSALTSGARYLCTRTSDDSFGARFRAEAPGGGARVYRTNPARTTYTGLAEAPGNGPLTVPAGTYLVTATGAVFWNPVGVTGQSGSARLGIVCRDSAAAAPTSAPLWAETVIGNGFTSGTMQIPFALQAVVSTADDTSAAECKLSVLWRVSTGSVGGMQCYSITAVPVSVLP